MKAVAAQNGRIIIIETDEPELLPGHVLIRTEYSAISPGTETGIARRSGEKPVILGYSAVGIVERIGAGVEGIQPGERLACYGAPYVRHAERLAVPANLTAAVPEHVDPREAAFAGLGAIAIHALRVADLRFGESAIVAGLGIIGNLIAQIACAAAYRTVGLDINAERAMKLRQLGLRHVYSDPVEMEKQLPSAVGRAGADAVILCAGGPGEALINRALEKWLRDRGKIVIVGDLTAEFSRAAMFAKEAQVLISRAGGPGRYDAQYEKDNRDYPIGYVRWTEGRNVGEYIRLLSERLITAEPLITGEYPLDRHEEAYMNYLQGVPGTFGTLIRYGGNECFK